LALGDAWLVPNRLGRTKAKVLNDAIHPERVRERLAKLHGCDPDSVRFISFAVAAPKIKSGTMLANGSFQVNFSGSSGQPFRVLSADSLTVPVATWLVLSNGNFGVGGFGSFSDTNVAVGSKQRFYRIVSP
jgi:hypothetical protein